MEPDGAAPEHEGEMVQDRDVRHDGYLVDRRASGGQPAGGPGHGLGRTRRTSA